MMRHLPLTRLVCVACTCLAMVAGCGGGKDGAADGSPGEVARRAEVDVPREAVEERGEALPVEDANDSAEIAAEVAEAHPGDTIPDDTEPDVPLPPQCPNGTMWKVGTKAFEEGTSAWGLDGVLGIRLAITDLDGDGWADLLIRNGGGPDDFDAENGQAHWVMRNTGQGKFEDVTQTCGLTTPRYSTDPTFGRGFDVVASGDVDNDGDLDIFTGWPVHDPTVQPQETSELMLNNGDGTFSLGPEDNPARFPNQKSVPAGTSFTDYDRDGNVDLWVTHNMVGGATQPLQDRLLHAEGGGMYEDVTETIGVKTTGWYVVSLLNQGLGHSWAWSAAACDLNDDGIPDLLASSYGRFPNSLFQGHWDKDKGFYYTNESVASGYAYDDRMDWSDNESARCFCKLHPDAEDCEGIPPPQYMKCETDADIFRWNHATDREPYRLGGNSGTTVCADVDNDGRIDLLTGEIRHWDVGNSSDPSELMFNLGQADVRFARPGNETTGLERKHEDPFWNDGDMTAAVFDFDNDGWADIYWGASDYPGNHGMLYHQDAKRQFSLVSTDDYFLHLRSHGVAVADFDRDGDLDIAVGHSKMRCGGEYDDDCYPTQLVRLFINQTGNQANWIQLDLEGGAGANRAAIGARVQVTANLFTQTQEVDGGHGHFGLQKDRVLHFGLGFACSADVTIRWPDKDLTTQTFTVDPNHRYKVKQGEAPVMAP